MLLHLRFPSEDSFRATTQYFFCYRSIAVLVDLVGMKYGQRRFCHLLVQYRECSVLLNVFSNRPTKHIPFPIRRSLHWIKITEHKEYKLLTLRYKVLTAAQPSYLHHFNPVQPPRSTRSSSLVTGSSIYIILVTTNNWSFFMVALRNRADHYIFALWFLCSSSSFFSSANLSGRRLHVYHTSTHGMALVRI